MLFIVVVSETGRSIKAMKVFLSAGAAKIAISLQFRTVRFDPTVITY